VTQGKEQNIRDALHKMIILHEYPTSMIREYEMNMKGKKLTSTNFAFYLALYVSVGQEPQHIMARWQFCNSRQLLCLGSAKTRSKRGLYASIHKNWCQRCLICFSCTDLKPKTWLDISKMPLAITSLALSGTEPGPNRAICLGY